MKVIKKVPKQEYEIIQLLNRAHKKKKGQKKKKKKDPIQNTSMIRSQGHMAKVDLHGVKTHLTC